MNVTGSNLVFSGTAGEDIFVYDGRGVRFEGFDSNGFSVWLKDCRDVYGKESVFRGGTTFQGVKGLHIEDSVFDAEMKRVDACRVMGDRQKMENVTYLGELWGDKPFDPEKLVYGRPAAKEGRVWLRTVSHRTGKEIWFGRKPEQYSQDVRFSRCKFQNSQKAGLFVHHTERVLVEDCESEDAWDYGKGFEWTVEAEMKRCKASGSTGGIVSHFMNISGVFEGNHCEKLMVFSQGDPVLDLTIRGNTVLGDGWQNGQIAIENGSYFKWSSAAWVDGVDITGNECNFVALRSGLVQSTEPETLIKNVWIKDNNVRWSRDNYHDAVRLESVDGYLLEGNNLNGGRVRDYSAGGRVPSTPLPLTPDVNPVPVSEGGL